MVLYTASIPTTVFLSRHKLNSEVETMNEANCIIVIKNYSFVAMTILYS